MGNYTYKEIITTAKKCQSNVKKEYRTGITSRWAYYFAKAIITPKDVKKINLSDAPKPNGTGISRQLTKPEYLTICKDLVKFVEKNQRMPNYVEFKGFKLTPHLLTEFLSRILVWYDKNNRLPSQANINSKVFTKPTETGNSVYDYACNKYGKKFTTIDEVMEYVKKYFKYEYYFDDHKSNKNVTDTKSGNCTDLLQWLWNMAKGMGYDVKCIHVQCRKSGTGHVRGQFKHSKHTGGKWINRDPAAVADGGAITSIWCSDGIKLSENPSWFMENVNR